MVRRRETVLWFALIVWRAAVLVARAEGSAGFVARGGGGSSGRGTPPEERPRSFDGPDWWGRVAEALPQRETGRLDWSAERNL